MGTLKSTTAQPTMAQNPALLSQLYNMNVGSIPSGVSYMPPNYMANASTNALNTYKSLMSTPTPSPAGPTYLHLAPPTPPTSMVASGPKGSGGGLTLPTYDPKQVESLAQRFAAPGIRNLRNAVQATQQGVYDNPNVGAMTVRQALQGYGAGLESVMSGALQSGITAYGQQYNPQVTAALTTFNAQQAQGLQTQSLSAQAQNQQYSLAYQAYLSGLV